MRRCVEVEKYICRCEHVKILSWDTLSVVAHSCGKLLRGTLLGHPLLQSRQFSSSSYPATPRTTVALQSRQFSSSSSPDTRAHGTHRPVACISRTRHARSPQRVAPDKAHFAHSTRAISAEGCATRTLACISRTRHARSPQGVAPDKLNRTLACISRPRRARSPQRAAPDKTKSHSHLHFAPSPHTISAEGCAGQRQIALSPAFRALDTHDLRRGLRRTGSKRTLACISRPRHARSPQRVARAKTKSHSCLRFAHSTRTISTEGCVSWRSGGKEGKLRRARGEDVSCRCEGVKMSRDVDAQM